MIREFIAAVTADGRMETPNQFSPAPSWILGLGSWDEECLLRGMATQCASKRLSKPT